MNKEDITYWLSSKWTHFTYIFRKPYYRLRLFKRFCKTKYCGAWEMVNPLLDYPFEIFCEYYEQCDVKNRERINIDAEPEIAKELCIQQNKLYDEKDILYNWYTKIKPQREEEIDYLLSVWSEHHACLFSHSTKYSRYLSDLHTKEELKFEQEKEEMLIRLIKIRNSCWD